MIIKTYDLTKRFGGNAVVDSLNLEIDEGQVYGFIGMNGAGKSTTLKMISGLLQPSSGHIELFGVSSKRELQNARKKISGYVDAPALYTSMTAMDNLQIFSKLNIVKNNKKSIREILKLVHLEDARNKKVSQFSLGMKQRLAIGCALLNSPEVVILDEPINGLDPSGIVEIRDIIKNLTTSYGTTFLISSHILSELEKIATNYGVISKGRLLEQISKQNLDEKLEKYFVIAPELSERFRAELKVKIHADDFNIVEGKLRIKAKCFDAIKPVVDKFDNSWGAVTQETQSLESYFFELVEGEKNAISF